MHQPSNPVQDALRVLQERAKELECLYRIDELLRQPEASLQQVLDGVIRAIPPAYQYPGICRVRVTLGATVAQSPDFRESPWVQSAPLIVEGAQAGRIDVCYAAQTSRADEGPFLKEERKLLNNIAEHLAHFIEHQRLRQAFENLESAQQTPGGQEPWRIILDFLRQTDETLLGRISRKMINHLGWLGIGEAVAVLHQMTGEENVGAEEAMDDNRPRERVGLSSVRDRTEEIFRIAGNYLSDDEILACVQTWIKEDKSRFLVTALGNPDATLDEIGEAIRRYHHIGPEGIELSQAARKGMRVSLISHFFTDQLEYINTAKRHVELDDFYDLVQHVVSPPKSRGKLGGKSAGLFLAAQVLKRCRAAHPDLGEVRVPKTWYITSDGLVDFIQYNNLEDVYNHKYAEIEQVRQEYPHIVQLFKNSQFSPEIVNGLSVILDDFADTPIIVRSSSLLEDRFGAAFSGKYKSLFLANAGTKQQRLTALMDAIAEVYASTFGPDPIEYRAERGLIEAYEEMAIMIQEVVGTRIGPYYCPAFAGVAFSRNEFRWSSRIKREDGLLRMVPGLGTRAVDRLKDDYPVLMAPGQPGLRVNVTPDEILRYSPKNMDVINLETGEFETVEVAGLLRAHGNQFPGVARLVSILDHDHVRAPAAGPIDFEKERPVVTFEGLIGGTPFIRQIRKILAVLQDELGSPVDIEFASDGESLHLLQCRPQSSVGDAQPVPIPRDIPRERILFSANRFVSNGRLPDLTHVVYVDPVRYNELPDLEELRAVGRAVGKLNQLLPKRQFVLMGPGRWGSRGDIKLGVNVTYSDINNAAALIEIARKKGNYVPDLSFGTHFFQDLVEASIRYLPLYPDDEGILFDELYLRRSDNILGSLLPEHASLADVLRVIDVPRSSNGMVLRILMNADLDEALGILVPPQTTSAELAERGGRAPGQADQHWRWRLRLAEQIASNLDPERFGVKALYVIGSTKNATAGPASDIDLLVHFVGTEDQRRELDMWLDGWSMSLAEMNYLRTGYRCERLLDVHYLTDEDIAQRTSHAVKIGAITDAARPLVMKGAVRRDR